MVGVVVEDVECNGAGAHGHAVGVVTHGPGRCQQRQRKVGSHFGIVRVGLVHALHGPHVGNAAITSFAFAKQDLDGAEEVLFALCGCFGGAFFGSRAEACQHLAWRVEIALR